LTCNVAGAGTLAFTIRASFNLVLALLRLGRVKKYAVSCKNFLKYSMNVVEGSIGSRLFGGPSSVKNLFDSPLC